ncbi:MAG TPA: exosortase K [Pyrinomonadaceae bacterium]
MTNRTKWSAQLFTVLLCALALKYFYSTTGPDDLRWILGPVTWLTSLLSGRSFSFEGHSGYMSSDHTFLIAASCAGVNFLITSFLLLAVKQLWTNRKTKLSWWFIPRAAFFAYLTTLVANTVRICIALELQRHPVQSDWLNANQIHRLEGIIVYFGFLFFLHLVTEGERMSVKYMLLPLAIYYFTTLGLPLMNGAYRRGGEFWEHAAFVVLIPLVLIIPVLLFRVFSVSQRLSTLCIKKLRFS